MTTDAWLAIAHHLAVFGLLAVLAMEWALARPGLVAADVERLAKVDAAYGATAGTVLVVGIVRVALGDQPADFYLENPFFWLKMASFGAVGLLSIGPTMRYLGWRRALAADGGALPAAAEVAGVRRRILIQLAVFPLIPVFAALMARGIGS
jgi:putative membrane protein